MTPPPTLEYESHTRPPRWLRLCVLSLIGLGATCTVILIPFCIQVTRGVSLDLEDLLFCLWLGISAVIFIAGAIKILRLSRHWAWTAFITILANVAALIYSFGRSSGRETAGAYPCCIYIPSIAVLIVIALLLGTLIKELNSRLQT